MANAPRTPLDQPALERLALRYVERFATSRGRLLDYLARKLRERGAAGPVDPEALADRLVALGYIDDAAYAQARAATLARRGYGARRVAQALHAARIDAETGAAIVAETSPGAAALAFARRRRIGPYAREVADPRTLERQIAAMARAGHAPSLARRIARMLPGAEPVDIDSE